MKWTKIMPYIIHWADITSNDAHKCSLSPAVLIKWERAGYLKSLLFFNSTRFMPMFQHYFDFFSSYGTSELSYLFTMHKGDPENIF